MMGICLRCEEWLVPQDEAADTLRCPVCGTTYTVDHDGRVTVDDPVLIRRELRALNGLSPDAPARGRPARRPPGKRIRTTMPKNDDDADDELFGLIHDLRAGREMARDETLPDAFRESGQTVAETAADELKKRK